MCGVSEESFFSRPGTEVGGDGLRGSLHWAKWRAGPRSSWIVAGGTGHEVWAWARDFAGSEAGRLGWEATPEFDYCVVVTRTGVKSTFHGLKGKAFGGRDYEESGLDSV